MERCYCYIFKIQGCNKRTGARKIIGNSGIINDYCEKSISYMNISLAVCSKRYPKKDENNFHNPYLVALMEGNDGCLYGMTSFWTHPITPIRSARDDLTILVYIKKVSEETELAHKVSYISSKKDFKERVFVHKYKSMSNNKTGQESGIKKHMTKK